MFLQNYNKDYSGIQGIHENIKFISGAGMLLSKNMCNILIKNKQSLKYNIIDDLAIGLFSQNNNIEYSSLTRFDVTSYYPDNINLLTKDLFQNHYHVRCKCYGDDNGTILLMEKVINLIYNF